MNTVLNRLGKIGFFTILLQLLVTSCYKIDLENFEVGTPEISFPQLTITVPSNLDTIELPITANLPWRVKTDADWLTFVQSNGEGTGTFKVAIARNRVTLSRTAEIIGYITGDTQVKMTVIQEGGEPAPDESRHFHVKVTGNPSKDGLSWANASTLEGVLDEVQDGDVIHIAEGTYIPTVTVAGGNTGNANDQTFEIAQNVHIIGG